MCSINYKKKPTDEVERLPAAQPKNKNIELLGEPATESVTKSSSIPSGIFDIPIIDISNIQSTSDFQSTVVTELTGIHCCLKQITGCFNSIDTRMEKMENRFEQLEQRVQQLTTRQQEACNFLLDKEISATQKSIDFQKKYQLQLPMDDQESFLKFEQLLETNDFLKRDVVSINLIKFNFDLSPLTYTLITNLFF